MSGFPDTPSELVKKARLGDEEAIEAIYTLLWAPAVNNAYYRMGCQQQFRQDAEDLVSEKLNQILRKLIAGEIEGDDNFSGYFYRSVTNAINDYFDERRHKRPMLTLSSFQSDEYDDSFEDQIANGQAYLSSDNLARFQPEENLNYTIFTEGLLDCLANLPEKQRSALYMFYYEHLSIKEICQIFDAKENTVKSWLRYARQNVENQIRKLQKEHKGFLTVLPMPFLLWVFEESAKDFVPSNASKFASEIVLADESLKNKHTGRKEEKEIKLKQVEANTHQLPQSSKVNGTAVSQTVRHVATKTVFYKIVVGIVMVGILTFVGSKFFASENETDTKEEKEKSVEVIETKYQAGLYSFTEDLTVYDSTSFDSANGYTVHVNDLGAGGNRIYLSEIIEKDEIYYGKIEGGYVCIDDGTQHLNYESEKPIMLSDYNNSSDFANACENPSLANGGLGGLRPEGWYFNYTAICDGTLIYY